MKLSFRWYGKDDKITLEHIRQIPGMDSIVTAVYDVPVGEVWSRESIAELKKMTEDAGLNFDVLAKIQEQTGTMPLVLHGGTGIPEEMIKKAISLGVSKINVNTECQLTFAAATRKYVEEGKDLQGKGFDPRKLLAPGFEAIKATVKEKMELFGSVNKA